MNVVLLQEFDTFLKP